MFKINKKFISYCIVIMLVLTMLAYISVMLYAGLGQLGKPFPGFFVYDDGIIAQTILPHWTGAPFWLNHPDLILEVNGEKFTKSKDLTSLVSSVPVGTEITYRFYEGLGKGERVVKVPTMKFSIYDFLLTHFIIALTSGIFILCGTLVFLAKPNTTPGWAILIMGITIGGVLIAHGYVREFTLFPFMTFIGYGFYAFAAPSFFLLTSIFEELRFFRGRPSRYLIFYFISAVIYLIYIAGYFQNSHVLRNNFGNLHLFYDTVVMAYLFFHLVRMRYSSKDQVIRQRSRLLLGGFSLMLFATVTLVGVMAFGSPVSDTLLFIVAISMPISIAYGLLRHNLFEVDEIVKRTAQYISVLAVFGALIALLIWIIDTLVRFMPLFRSIVFHVGFILFVLYIVVHLKRAFLDILDRIYYRKKIDYNKVYESVRSKLMVGFDLQNILDGAKQILVKNLFLSNAEIMLKNEIKSGYQSLNGRCFFGFEEEIIGLLKVKQSLISTSEISTNPGWENIKYKCLAQMARVEAKFAIPLQFKGEIHGLLILGEKKSGEPALNLDDVNILNYLTDRIATTLENIRMYRELETAKEELKKLNVILEERVRMRTEDLMAKVKALNTANERISTATRHKSEFLASMSHELRTPLSGIIMYTELVLGGVYEEVNEVVKEVFKDMHYNGKALLQLINDLLDFSKLEAKKLGINKEEFSTREVVDGVAMRKVGEAKKKTLELIGEFEKDLPLGMGDAMRVAQILENLVGNAIKFNKAGKVIIRVRWEEGKRVLIQVEDSGIGIPKDRLANIFNEFEQLESPLIKEYKGIGLGLALSKRLIELMGGEMEVTSEVGKGSTFSILIPVKAEEEKFKDKEKAKEKAEVVEYNKIYEGKEEIDAAIEEIRKRRVEGRRKIGKKILSIEDNPSNQKIISDMLIDMGYQVIEAKNGMEGLEKLISEKPDLVITDVQMPRLDGMTLIKTIRKEKQPMIRGIPIIISSASVLKGDVEKGLAAGADAYITKPFKFSEMISVVKKCLGEEEK